MDHRFIARATLALLGAVALGACSVNTAPPAATVATPAVVTPAPTVAVPAAPSTVVVQPHAY
ncbi:MAG TPA: hypothetical protein VJY39_07940 [Acidisphaera sp.]|nr:hypothetical protein [Acidisphaera sp.]